MDLRNGIFLILTTALLSFPSSSSAQNESLTTAREHQRDGKLLSLFNIVKFHNDPCKGTGNKNGTCYTASECQTKSGTNGGSCASGYGVCCLFTVNCGARISENCTYFESTGSEAGACKVTICRCNSNVCQLRLDFSTFIITGPSTSTLSVAKTVGGQIIAGGAKEVGVATQCLTDTFTVTNPSGLTPPSICGTNTNSHMYVDASESCNDLVFQLGQSGMGAAISTRKWSIKITQYSCDYQNLAPEGCTQYYFGSTSNTVNSFNFYGGTHLADQNQNICVRRERGTCKICWSAAAATDVALSGKTDKALEVTKGSSCCGYGMDGMGTGGYDCITIPGAVKNTVKMSQIAQRICGRSMGLVSKTMGTATTVCSTRLPFSLRFLSDHYEFAGEKAEINKPGVGFRLTYTLQPCSST